jgi:hypothetical protein
MSSYDGPSFYKKNHPRVKSIRQKPQPQKKEKVSWPDKKNRYESEYKKKLPDRVQTRGDLKAEAIDHMKMPTDSAAKTKDNPIKRKQPINKKIDEERRRLAQNRFRSKAIPPSLQHLDGWKKGIPNPQLMAVMRERLAKDKDSYILLAKDVDASERELEAEKEAAQKSQTSAGATKNDFSEKDQEKAERVKKEIKAPLAKPGSGLHRSLSKIMAEEREILENGRTNLGSLFSKY